MLNCEKEYTKSGNMKAPQLGLLCSIVIKTWDKVKTESLIKSFKKCCILNALDGTEDNILWEDEDINENENEAAGDTQNDIDDWDNYYDDNVVHEYLNNYTQDVSGLLS